MSPETFRSSEFPDHLFSDERKGTFDRRTTPVGSAKTNAEGSATFRVKVPEDLRIPSALRAVVGVTVQEFSGRGANAFLSRRVDVLPYYLGLKLGSPDEDGCIEVDVLAVDREGRQVHDDRVIQLSWERLVSSRGYRRDASGTFTYVSETIPMPEGRQRMALKNGRGRVKVPVSEHARIRVNVTDEGQGVSASRCITTGAAVAAPERADRVKLELNKEGVSAGDEVELRIHAPFSGNALITLETDRVLEQWVEPVPGEEHSIRFTVPDIPQPNFWVRVTAIRPQPVEGAHPVLRSDGALAVRMDRDGFRMNVNLVVPDHVLPGRNQRVEVQVDPGAEVVVAAVDEGILRLNGFETPNPFRWFQKLRRNGLIQWDMFDALLPELGTRFRSGDPKMGGGGSSMGTRLNPVQGKRFKPLALWSGTLLADTNGIAIFDAPLPEFSGSIRWMAVAVGTNRLGAAGKTSRVSRPVVVQQSLPLFLSPGDETEWTFRIQNMTQEEKEIQMTPQLSGPVEIEWKGEAVTLQAGETRVMRIPLRAGKDVGVASCSITVRDGDEQWNDLIELTGRPAEPWRSRQRIVTVEAGKEVKFPAWANVMASTAERKLQMSVMPSLQLAGALDYLVRYPYGCVEQTVSSAFPLLYVPELAPESWKENQVKAQIQSGIFRLWRMQLRDGSFGYWPGARQASESGTIYALEFLLAANQRGFEVDSGRLKAGLACVTRWMKDAGFDNGGSMSNVRTARICALLAGADQLEHGWRQRLWEKRGALPSLGRIYAAEAFLLSGDPDRAGRMLENLPLSSLKSWSWQSHVSQKAECLRVLAAWNPWDPRVPGLASSVLSDQRKGRWESTYENASVIRALAVVQALALPAGSEPRVLMKPHGEASTMETNQFYQVEANEALVVKNMGTTTVYLQEIRNGVASSPEEVNGSIQVTRRFLRTDGTELDTLDVKQGDLVLIEIELSGLVEELEHLVISERLPAGLELLPVKTQRTLEHVVSWDGVMKGQACTHMEIRDDRALLFPTPVGGDARFYLLTRAVTPGRYLAPASYVEGMYDETQQGQGEPVSVRVLP